jgi:nitroreductase
VVVTDRDRLKQLAQVWTHGQHVALSAATIGVVASVPKDDYERTWIPYDLGQATMSIMLEAVDLGVGSGHSAVGDQDLARSILGFPDDHYLAFLIALGYPADRPLTPILRPNRRPFDEVVHREHW